MEEMTEVVSGVKSRKKRRGCLIFGLVVLVGLGWWLGPVIKAAFTLGLLEKVDKRTYDGNTMQNFKAMHQAMMLYHDSEDAFPDGSEWMGEIENRMRAFDMDKTESSKKLVSPEFRDQPGKYGYAMNDLCSRKYKDDIKRPELTPLLFDSSDLTRNAHGLPEKLLPSPPRQGQNRGVSVEGQMLKL
jgi:hypothetical protein